MAARDIRYERRDRRVERENPEQGNPQVPERRIEDSFRKQRPPTFNGLGDPTEAEKWVRSLDRIFDYLGCTSQEKVNCAVFQLVEEADYWWESEQRAMTAEARTALTWDEFKAFFFEKYIPKSYRHQKESEFWNLRQGTRTVTEYDRIFNQLARYAPTLVDTDEKRAERFRQGLRPVIGMPLASHGRLTYAEALSRALGIEAAMPKDDKRPPNASAQNSSNKRNWEVRNPNFNNQGKRPWQGQAPPGQEKRPAQACQNCGKSHQGACRLGTNACFTCGQTNHFRRDCPKNQQTGPNRENQGNPVRPQQNQGGYQRNNQGGNPRNNQGQGAPHAARAYAINQQEAAQAQGDLAGMIEISSTPIVVLFDTGASHTFISNDACASIKLDSRRTS